MTSIETPEREWERERLQKNIAEAQKYSDDELDEGMIYGEIMDLNLFEYVDMPLGTGTYEVYVTYFGLESNHCFVEIVFEDE